MFIKHYVRGFLMEKSTDWNAQRDWLNANIGCVETKWIAPGHSTSSINGLETFDRSIVVVVTGIGETGEDSVRALFSMVAERKPCDHIRLRRGDNSVVITPDLDGFAWTPPGAQVG